MTGRSQIRTARDLDDALRKALDHGRLAHARLADQNGVVLGPPGEDLHDPLDLLLPADDRVELALAGGLGEVAAELVEHQRRRRRALAATARAALGGLLALVAAEQLEHLLADPVEIGSQLDQDLRRDALALADQAEQDVLGADVVVAELQRLAQRQLQHLLGPRRERDVPARCLLALADDLLDLLPDALQGDPEGFQGLCGHTLALVDEAEEDVLGADVVVVEHPGFFLRQDDNPPRSVCEPLEHSISSPTAHERAATPDDAAPRTPTPTVSAGWGWTPVARTARGGPRARGPLLRGRRVSSPGGRPPALRWGCARGRTPSSCGPAPIPGWPGSAPGQPMRDAPEPTSPRASPDHPRAARNRRTRQAHRAACPHSPWTGRSRKTCRRYQTQRSRRPPGRRDRRSVGSLGSAPPPQSFLLLHGGDVGDDIRPGRAFLLRSH